MRIASAVGTLALGLSLAGLAVDRAHAAQAVTCRAFCIGESECRVSGQPPLGREPRWVADCQNAERRVESGCVDFWYFSRMTPRPARVCQGQTVAAALKDPDGECSPFWACLRPRAARPVPGAQPIGPDEDSAASSGAAAGLPYGTILMPVAALDLSASGDAAGASGTLTLREAETQRVVATVPIRSGAASLRPGVLVEASAYVYSWETSGATLQGSFKTATAGARADVPIASATDASASAREEAQWKTVRSLTTHGYRWDAARNATSLQRSAP